MEPKIVISPESTVSDAFVVRMIRFYSTHKTSASDKTELWKLIIDNSLSTCDKTMLSGDVVKIKEVFSKIYDGSHLWGIDNFIENDTPHLGSDKFLKMFYRIISLIYLHLFKEKNTSSMSTMIVDTEKN